MQFTSEELLAPHSAKCTELPSSCAIPIVQQCNGVDIYPTGEITENACMTVPAEHTAP